MFQSLKLGRVFGIDVFVHPTFWLLPLFVLVSGTLTGGLDDAALDLAVVFAIFGCVALHELGHALAARLYDITTRDITLYPIGGVARLENMPERAWPEIVIALAGPAVNVAIAVAIGVLAVGGGTLGSATGGEVSFEAFWSRLLIANVGLVVFNLIPAFPMDGGRVFRALVSLVADRVTATTVAAYVGTAIAGLMALYGLYETQFMLVVLAAFVFLTGQAELAGVRQQDEYRRAERRAVGRVSVAYPRARRVAEPLPIDGWEFDAGRRVWTFWENGYPVRRVWLD